MIDNGKGNYSEGILHSPWFHNDLNDWRIVFKDQLQKFYNKNEIIYHQGDINHFIYYVIKGRVRTSLLDKEGNEKSMIVLNEGSIFGESCAFDQTPTVITTTANTNCTLSYIHRDKFLATVFDNPYLCEKLVFNLSRKLIALKHHIREITFMNAHEIVINHLYKLSLHYGSDTKMGRKISIKFTHQEMADLSGTSRVTVSNIMRFLAQSGTIKKINGYYYLTNINEFEKWINNK
ncbi:Crp/Fnr family transcriptional regulator [Pseudalkalibacillus sp. A8]|uniref:Crp/Fnr family transcriptional regulator n=1 Tax=Pseudalkalibacillus sp. A8 TaxID=3382641 RepID=UPI0038B47650